jgi:hypothetical protein
MFSGFRSAREDQRVTQLAGLHGEIPIEAGTGAAGRSGHVGVEQPGMGGLAVFGQAFQGFRTLDPECLEDPHPPEEGSSHLGRLPAMELDRIEIDLGEGGVDQSGGGIDEESDAAHERRQAPDDGRGPPRFDEPGRSGDEDESQGVGPRVDGRPRILLPGDAADLDAQGHEGDLVQGDQNCRSVTAPSLAVLTVAAYLASTPRV